MAESTNEGGCREVNRHNLRHEEGLECELDQKKEKCMRDPRIVKDLMEIRERQTRNIRNRTRKEAKRCIHKKDPTTKTATRTMLRNKSE